MKWITAAKGEKNKYALYNDQPCLTIQDIEKFLCGPVRIFKHLSDDFVIVTDNWKDYENYGPNEVASLLIRQPVYGDCLILDPKEFDYEDWLRVGDRERYQQVGGTGVCQGKGTGPARREVGTGRDVQGSSGS